MKHSPNCLFLRQVSWSLLLGLLASAIGGSALAQTTKWRFVAAGDTRGSTSADPVNSTVLSELANEIVRQQATFVLVPGDLAYSGSFANFQLWTNIMSPVYQAGIGVFPVMGNHDINDVTSFLNVFGNYLPDNGPTAEVNRTYAFTCDNALVLGLDTYVHPGQVNQQWIDSVLQANTRPHVFVFGHMPAFKANHTDCLDDYPTQRDAFWHSLINAGGRAYFCGHDHFYDHMWVNDGNGNPDNDTHQFIVGGGGAPLYTTYAYDGANTIWLPTGIFHENNYSYLLVEVDGLTITMTAYHRTGANAYAPAGDVWSYTVPAPTPPPAPTGLTATAGDAQVTLKWTASPGATSYNVKRSAGGPNGTYTTIATGVTLTQFSDTGVVNGTTYYYVVTALNTAGESASSAYAGATPNPAPLPTAPVLNAVTGRRQINLTWTASTGATSYTVKRFVDPSGTYSLLKTGLTTTKYTDRKVRSGVTYYYVILAVNASGETDSNVASATAR